MTKYLSAACAALAICLSAVSVAEKLDHDPAAIKKAAESVANAAPKAKTDPNRPIYHYMPAARWMNDPNGAFFADGWHHVFHQFNPYGNGWGNMHWAHARSRDNVTWERLPIGVWPSTEKGEDHCYSGSAVRDGDGKWRLWYTSVSKVREKDKSKGRLQWVFNGQMQLKPMDKDYIKWGKTTADPVNKPNLPNNIDGYAWNKYIRDPTFFTAGGKTFMLLGITGKVAPIYEAADKDLSKWTYRGTMIDDAWDCPQMIPFKTKAGTKWVYVKSRGAPPKYHVGTFDPKTAKFTSERSGKLDQGGNYHTISFLTDDKSRHITYSWICRTRGKGWNNCMAIPRVMTLGADGHPVQKPISEMSKLRGEKTSVKDLAGYELIKAEGDALEIHAVFDHIDISESILRVRRSKDGKRSLDIKYRRGTLNVFGRKIKIEPEGKSKRLELRVFCDKSIFEVFVNGGKKTVAHVAYPPAVDLGIEVYTDGTCSIDVWKMKSIWNK